MLRPSSRWAGSRRGRAGRAGCSQSPLTTASRACTNMRFPSSHGTACRLPVFLVTGHSGMTHTWPGRGSGFEGSPLLSWREIKTMARAGVTFGSHTETHADLRRLDVTRRDREIVGSKRPSRTRSAVRLRPLAYPYGAHDARGEKAGAGTLCACLAATLGFVTSRSDPFALERLDMYYFRRPTCASTSFPRCDARVRARTRALRPAAAGFRARRVTRLRVLITGVRDSSAPTSSHASRRTARESVSWIHGVRGPGQAP